MNGLTDLIRFSFAFGSSWPVIIMILAALLFFRVAQVFSSVVFEHYVIDAPKFVSTWIVPVIVTIIGYVIIRVAASIPYFVSTQQVTACLVYVILLCVLGGAAKDLGAS